MVDLDGQFPGRCENHDARVLLAPALQRLRPEQEVESRDQKRRRLAGPRLRLSGNVLAGQRDRQRGRLDRGAVFESGLGNSRHNGAIEPETVET